MPTTPDEITFAVQRCRELAGEAGAVKGPVTLDDAVRIGVSAVYTAKPLTVVLAEMERLREVERERSDTP